MAPLVEASIRVGSVHVGSSADSGLYCAALDWGSMGFAIVRGIVAQRRTGWVGLDLLDDFWSSGIFVWVHLLIVYTLIGRVHQFLGIDDLL